MLTIQDLQRIMSLPNEPLNVNEKRVKKVIDFKEEFISFLDNLNLYPIESIEQVNDIIQYWYVLERASWLKNKCVIGIMGGYSAGKSSLLNSLLGTNLPTGINPVTAVSTYVTYGREEKHCLVDNDDNVKQIPQDMISRLSQEEINGFDIRKLIEHTVLFKTSVAKNISFLDTPGITANDYDYQTTIDASKKCDVVLWLLKAQSGAITNNELKFIKKYLKDKKLYIVLTYADRVANIENIKSGVLSQLRNANVECEDVFYYGLRSNSRVNIEANLSKMRGVFEYEANHFKQFQPQVVLNNYLSSVASDLNTRITEATDVKNELAASCRDFERHIDSIHTSLIDNTNSLCQGINSLQSTITNRCSTAYFCSKTFQVISSDCSSMITKYNNMVDSLNKFNVSQVIEYGKTSSNLDRITEILDNLITSRNQCIGYINNNKNLLK